MDSGKIIKVIVTIAVIVVALPFAAKLLPKAITFERAQAAFQASGLPVTEFKVVPNPSNESVGEAMAQIGSAVVNIYQYDNEGPLARYTEYQRTDPGQAMVQAMGLAQSLGAAVRKETPHRYARRKMFLIVATGDDTALLDRIIAVFERL